MLIAVTSSNGVDIDTHFGKAERFLIYEIGPEDAQLAGEVRAQSYCDWDATLQGLPPEQFTDTVASMRECAEAPPPHRMMPDKLAAISQALGDCRVVVTAMIGEAPRQELERLGIAVHCLEAPVADVLREVRKLY